MPENQRLREALEKHEAELAKMAGPSAGRWDGVLTYDTPAPKTLAELAREASELMADLRTHNKLSPVELARIDACRAGIRKHLEKP